MPVRQVYVRDGRTVNDPQSVARVKDSLPVPESCRFCSGRVDLVNNAAFYGGREFGWPLAYACSECGARVGCHPGTDIPLGTLADKETILARRAAHAAFDPLWQNKGPGTRARAYRDLSKAMGRKAAHISWMDAADCLQVVKLVQSGALNTIQPTIFRKRNKGTDPP